MLQKLERLACFFAALLALLIEACFVYCLRMFPPASVAAKPFASSGGWIGPTLPQCWLAGALVALFYYLIHASRRDQKMAAHGRRTFLRTWYWFLALASAQGCTLYLNFVLQARR